MLYTTVPYDAMVPFSCVMTYSCINGIWTEFREDAYGQKQPNRLITTNLKDYLSPLRYN